MIPEAQIVHRTAQRVRIKIPSQKGRRPYFEALRQKLAAFKKFENLAVNPLSGSVLIISGDLDLKDLVSYAEAKKLFLIRSESMAPKTLPAKVAGPIQKFSADIKHFTGGELDLPGALFVALLLYGAIEIIRGRFTTPPWYTVFWYAFGIFTKSLIDKAGCDQKAFEQV